MGPDHPVHSPWIEVTDEDDVKWQPTGSDRYTGNAGRGTVGPSSAMMQVMCDAKSLACIFLFMVPLSFFEQVSTWTKKFCYKDWVVEKFASDRDGNQKKRRHFVEVPAKTGRNITPGRRHRADKERKQYTVTAGFVLCWVAMLILQGAHFGSDKRSAAKLWRAPPYGLSISYLQNSMTRDAYVFMRQYIHFADNATRKSKGEIGYHAFFKVKYALDIMMEGMKKSWTAGKHVTIDESMIRYMGRAISYVQYMPAKPIKHGIKVFALCCAFSAVILAFKVYVGKEDETDGTAVGVCNDLCIDAGLTESRGRVLYTDNYYTSVKLAKHMFNEYG